MKRPADAVVLGFTKGAELCEKSFAPLRQLKQEGVLRDIHYVTWSSPELDRFVEPVLAMDDVNIVRVPQPHVTGAGKVLGSKLQAANLGVALDQIEDGDTLVLKTRPDLLISLDFLRAKICNFDTLCAIPSQTTAFGVELSKPPFAMKIWLPWANANIPLFYDDSVFLGLKRDVSHLVTPASAFAKWFEPLEYPEECYAIPHAVRFGPILLDRFPIFRRYMDECLVFQFDEYYRKLNLQFMLNNPFFWCLVIANAWILYTGFHVDFGKQGDLAFYPNADNKTANWSDMSTLRLPFPYYNSDALRASLGDGQRMDPVISSSHGRLFDDNWQRTMFTGQYSDFPMSALEKFPRLIASYPNEAVEKLEEEFYGKLWGWYREHEAELEDDMDLNFANMRVAMGPQSTK